MTFASGCDWVCWIQWCVYMPILVFGFPLNLAALWQLWFRVRRWSESSVYLGSLILSDSLLMFSLPFKILAYKKDWPYGRIFCWLLESLLYVNIYGSIFLSVCIAVDRYIALQFPFAARRLRSSRRASVVCAAMWVVFIFGSIPIYTLHNPDNENQTCFQGFSNSTWSKSAIPAMMETVFCSCTLVMVFCSVRVAQILRDLRSRNPGDSKLRNNKSMKIVLSNLVVFLTCFIPYHVAALLYFHAKTNHWDSGVIDRLRFFVHISMCLSSINCLADGACYYFILKENLESAKLERRMAIPAREMRIRDLKTSSFGHNSKNASKNTEENEICVDTGFT